MDFTAIGAGLAALTGIGAGIGIGIATSRATDAVARQPEASNKIMMMLLRVRSLKYFFSDAHLQKLLQFMVWLLH